MTPFDPSAALAEIDAKIEAETRRSERLILAILRKGHATLERLHFERSQIMAGEKLREYQDTHPNQIPLSDLPEGADTPVSIAVALIDILYAAGTKGLSGKELRAKTVAATRKPVDSVARAISRTRTRGDIDRGPDLRWRITTQGKRSHEKLDDPK